jgi:ribosomal protein S18 acetylase RimI-like enzyme
MNIAFRPATADDFDYCASLYFAGMDTVIRDLNLDMAVQTASFRRRWEPPEVRIIMRDAVAIGWLQVEALPAALFLKQLFVEGAAQRQGIGTAVMHRLIGEAADAGRPMTLGVVKTNPARRLYERLGFRVTDEDERKFYMRRESIGALRRDRPTV